MLKLRKLYQVLRGNSKGVSLIEVIVALAILGIIAVAFLGGLATTLNATRIADERSVAQSLAQGQMEYVKSCDYASSYTPAPIPSEYVDYHVTIESNELEVGLQKITVTVKHNGKEVFTLEDYKVDR